MSRKLTSALAGIARGLRAMLGAPDYERYVAHLRDRHPECAPMSRAQFVEDRMQARYSRPGARCC